MEQKMPSFTLLLAYSCNLGQGWVQTPQQCPSIAVNTGQAACFLGTAAELVGTTDLHDP